MLRTSLIPVIVLAATCVFAAPRPQPADITFDANQLHYAIDEHGNRVPDFSSCGYLGGDVPIPNTPIAIVVSPMQGDNTSRLQRAIDSVASLPLDEHGLRGAVLLQKGRYEIAGQLNIFASGVVLRGSGMGNDGTVLFASGHDRRALIRVGGKNDRQIDSRSISIADKYVPVSATKITLADASNLKPGDTILIRRPCSAEWIKALGMDYMGGDRHSFVWKPGSRDLLWDRTIKSISDKQIVIDAPITCAIDAAFGGGSVTTYTWPGRISQIGIENLRCDSSVDPSNPKDEDHSWCAITIENVSNAWVRQVTFEHFAGSAVTILDTCKQITVEDCKSLAPVSEIAGYRRHTFFIAGQQCLFQRCYSENGRHDFSVGFCSPGPNAFVQCLALNPSDDSGPIDSWACGVLYDNVRINGNALSLYDRRYRDQGAGWGAANSVLWQCSASVLNCYSPPTATNWAFGCWGQFDGNGKWSSGRESIKPVSLYYQQLSERVGESAAQRADIMAVPSDPSSSPEADVAARLIAASAESGPRLDLWIDQASKRHPIPTDASNAKVFVDPPIPSPPPPPHHGLMIRNGQLVTDQGPVAGHQHIKWWAGGVRPEDIASAGPNITRFVPGRIGAGLTDDLNQLTDQMFAGRRMMLDYHYGLWYDTRDADHERIRRMDGDVWPPFYELPFARSGTGIAWDGLSKYDLTKYNQWYFLRMKQFADLADQKGLVLVPNHFFQHNILEAGAHWASCPWRTANNINNTGFPEPPPYAGDKRIFMAEQFYDVTNPARREIYRAYIRKCLDNTKNNTNVIHLTSAEFTGPLHFMQFWLDCVAEWEKETGTKATIGLSATKDVQDAVLADPVRSKIVSVIDIQYWWYQSDGSLYAPQGGQNLAPRQHERVIKHKGSSAEQILRAVREYREKYPDKAVMVSGDENEKFAKAVEQ